MSAQISRDEWLQALGAAATAPCDPSAITMMELAAMLGVSRMVAYRHMLRLLDEGRATVTYKMAPTKTGHSKRVPAYKLVKPKAKK